MEDKKLAITILQYVKMTLMKLEGWDKTKVIMLCALISQYVMLTLMSCHGVKEMSLKIIMYFNIP